MQFSTNLPSGHTAIREYVANRGNTRLPMNVSAEADAAYIAEKGLQIGPVTLKSWPVGKCSRCSGVIRNAPFLSAHELGEFCSRECRDGCEDIGTTRRKRHFTQCLGCGRKFLAKRANNTTCSAKCRQRACRASENSELPPMSQIPENATASAVKTLDLQV